jgi:hypothetical protein
MRVPKWDVDPECQLKIFEHQNYETLDEETDTKNM